MRLSPALIAKYIQVFLLCQKFKWDWLFIVIISKFLYDKETLAGRTGDFDNIKDL